MRRRFIAAFLLLLAYTVVASPPSAKGSMIDMLYYWCCETNTTVSNHISGYGAQVNNAISEFNRPQDFHVTPYTWPNVTCNTLRGHVDYFKFSSVDGSFAITTVYRIEECVTGSTIIAPCIYYFTITILDPENNGHNLKFRARASRCSNSHWGGYGGTQGFAEYATVEADTQLMGAQSVDFRYHTITHELGHVFGMGHKPVSIADMLDGECDIPTIMVSKYCTDYPRPTTLQSFDMGWLEEQYPH